MRRDGASRDARHMNEFDNSRTSLIWSAFLAGLCPLIANSVHEDETSSGEAILSAASTEMTTPQAISVVLHLVGFLALAAVLGVLAAGLARRTPALAAMAAIAGAAAIAVKISEAMTGMALRTHGDAVDPATAELLVGIDEAGFIVYGFLFSAAFAAVGLGLARGSGPAWLGWAAVIAGGLGVLAATVGVVTGSYVPVPFLLLLLWLLALGIVAARNPSRQAVAVAQ